MSAVADAEGWVVESTGELPAVETPRVTDSPSVTLEQPAVAAESTEEAQARARDEKGRFAAIKAENTVVKVEEARADAAVETSPTPEADKPPSKRSPEGRKLTLRQEIDALVREREAVRREVESARQLRAPSLEPRAQTDQPSGFPGFDVWAAEHPDHPDPFDGYYTAKAEHVADQRFQQHARVLQTQTAAQQLQSRGKEAYSDWADTFASVGDIKISPQLEQVLLTDPDGHRLAYELAKHPDQHSNVLDASDALSLGVALGTLKARLGSVPLAPPPSQTNPAPPPIQPVGSSHASLTTVSLDDKPWDQWSRADQEAYRLAERKKGRR